jgi:hypothetical protein
MKVAYIFWIIFLIMLLTVIPFTNWNPTQAEVESFFDGGSCSPKGYVTVTDFDTEHDCTYYLRRHTFLAFGQISNIPWWWILPNFALYTSTPFQYFNYIDPITTEMHSYFSVKTRDKGTLVYNPVTGEYLGLYDLLKEESLTMEEFIDIAIAEAEAKQKASNSPCICSYNAYDCVDFTSRASAQSCFEECGGINNDIHWLDVDGDGSACELSD